MRFVDSLYLSVIVLVLQTSLCAQTNEKTQRLNPSFCVTEEDGSTQCPDEAGMLEIIDNLGEGPYTTSCNFGQDCVTTPDNPMVFLCGSGGNGTSSPARFEYLVMNSGSATSVPKFKAKQNGDNKQGYALKPINIISCFSVTPCECVMVGGRHTCQPGTITTYQLARYELDPRVLCEADPEAP